MAGSAGGVVRMGLSHLSPEALAAFVRASCVASGVTEKVTDPLVVRRVGVLLGAAPGAGRERKRSGTRTGHAGGSVAPDDVDSGGVDRGGSARAGTDCGVVDERGDDGVLSGQVQFRPRAS